MDAETISTPPALTPESVDNHDASTETVIDVETQVLSINLITRNPQVRRGRPCIIGTGILVSTIAIQNTVFSETPEQIAQDFRLPLAQVYAALAYYYEHQAAIDAQIAESARTGDEFRRNQVGSRRPSLHG